jgi:hypothetical protein
MKQSVTILGTLDSTNEKEWILLVRSLRANGGFYSYSSVYLTKSKDCSDKVLSELERLNCVVTETAKKAISTFAVWLKPSTIFLKEPVFENLYDHEVAAHCKMLDYNLHWNHKTKQKYIEHLRVMRFLKELLVGSATPDYYRQLDDWFVQIPTTSFAGRCWFEEITKLKKILFSVKDDILDSEFVYADECSSSIALSLLEMTRKYEFTEPKGTGYQYADKNTSICYYGDWNMVTKIVNTPWVKQNVKEIGKLLK